MQSKYYFFTISLFCLLVTNEVFCQSDMEFGKWDKIQQEDEFGDKSEGFTYGAYFKGEMSNSMVNGAEACFRVDVQSDLKSLYIQFADYCTSKASLPDEEFITVQLKDLKTNEKLSCQGFFYRGMLVFTDGKFMEIFKEHKEMKMLVDISRVNKYIQSKYVFTIKYPDNL